MVLEWFFSSFNVSPDYQEHWENAPSETVGLEWDLRFYNLSGDVEAAGPWTTSAKDARERP